MLLMIFDTETTGLPIIYKNPAFYASKNWPHIASISWVIFDTEKNEILKERDYIIKPMNWVIPEDSTKIHGITHDQAVHQGTDLSYVMNEFLNETYDCLVAHNMYFDYNVVMNAIQWDLGWYKEFECKKLCTMLLSTDICKLPGKYGHKWPSLKELYMFTFGKMPSESNLHSSKYDTQILVDIIKNEKELRQRMGI